MALENDQQKPQIENDIEHTEQPFEESEITSSFFTEMFGITPYTWAEGEIADPRARLEGMERQEDGSFLFDSDGLDQKEEALIAEYLRYIDGEISPEEFFAQNSVGWYYAEESEEWRQQLGELLRQRREALQKKQGDEFLKMLPVDLDESLKQGMGFMRDLSKRRRIKGTLDKQFKDLPIAKYFDQNGQEIPVELIDYALISTPSGPELLITSKDPNRSIDKIATYGKEELQSKFEISAVKKNIDTKPTPSGDQTHFEIEVEKSAATTKPIFSTIRVLKQPANLSDKIDEFIKEQEEREAETQRRISQRAQQQYQPSAPSAPSTPRYSQPTSYTRSG